MTAPSLNWRNDWPMILIIGLMIIAMPLGIGLAIYLDEPSWLTMSLSAFILIYAG